MPSERECVLRERKAWREGVNEGFRAPHFTPNHGLYDNEAERLYPLPTVTRLREVPVHDGFVRWNDDHPEYRMECGEWGRMGGPLEDYPPEWIRAVADAKANPTEEVEDGS